MAALQSPAVTLSNQQITITQGLGNTPVSFFGTGAQHYPPLENPTALSLASVPQVWGWRRDRWIAQTDAVIAGRTVYPVQRSHVSATKGSGGVCGLHFQLKGSAFEVLFAGIDVGITLVVDGRYVSPSFIATTLSGGIAGSRLSTPNTFVRIDFGVAAARKVSLYARSTQGPCAIGVAADDVVQPWDRSGEATMGAMADSYGGASGPFWGVSGPFWEAAALLGIAHVDLDAVGGTGYAPNSAPGFENPGDAFPARLPGSVDVAPDLFITAGGINDNNAYALPPYATPATARAGFETAVNLYYTRLRAALPQSVLVALGPWAPRQAMPTDAIAQSKADAVKAALQTVGGPWVFLDNLNGGWSASSGAQGQRAGPWQTGTGNSAAPAGNGNGDLYLDPDGVHPNRAGCLYLASRIAADLRLALPTL